MVTELHAGARPAIPGPPATGAAASSRQPRRGNGNAARVQDAPATVTDWHGFHTALRRAALAATQSGSPLSLLMLERASGSGQPASDPPVTRPIEALAGIVATGLDPTSALARYGEERLAVILMGVDLSKAISEAERIGRSIAPGDGDQAAGAVIGVAQFRDDESLGHLIERVTDAVVRARSAGQQVTVAEHRLRRRSWRAARGTDATLCPCGLYASPCACGLV